MLYYINQLKAQAMQKQKEDKATTATIKGLLLLRKIMRGYDNAHKNGERVLLSRITNNQYYK